MYRVQHGWISATCVTLGTARAKDRGRACDSGDSDWLRFRSGEMLYVNTESASHVDEVISVA